MEKRLTKPKRRITQKQLLKYLTALRPLFLPFGAREHMRAVIRGAPDLDRYFPFSLGKSADQLERRGLIEKISTKEGVQIKITDRGKTQLLLYQLDDLKPPVCKWDGKWRLVFFDIGKIKGSRRDKFRNYLRQIGMEMFQESVFVSPYDITGQVKYLREILDIPDSIKMARLDWVENEDDLKEIFQLNK